MNSRSGSRKAADDLLRECVREILLEDIATLKKWMLASYNPEERELAKLDIIPVGRGKRGESEIGAGLFNRVREVLYKGKRAAARYSNRPEELQSLLKFVDFRQKLAPKYRKHFPKVYTTFEFNGGGIKFYGAVLELLEPMPAALEFDIDTMSLRHTLQRSRVSLLDKPGFVRRLLPKGTPEDHRKILSMFKKELKPLIDSMIGQKLDDVDEAIINHAYSKQWSMYSDFAVGVWKTLRSEVIPSSGENSRESIAASKHHSKAVRDFYDFLQALKEHGLQWEDLHTGNFMVRPGTNDFVVVDPGLFTDVSTSKTYHDL